jgi:hypothetical protein
MPLAKIGGPKSSRTSPIYCGKISRRLKTADSGSHRARAGGPDPTTDSAADLARIGLAKVWRKLVFST